jgi:U3 small nucleolar RNA-associated protein 23
LLTSNLIMSAVVTPCVIHELGQLGKTFSQSTYTALKKYDRRQCRHDSPKSARECLYSLVTDNHNQHHYCIASQDGALRAKCRLVPGIPLIYMKNTVVILEPPSPSTTRAVQQVVMHAIMHILDSTHYIKHA